MRYLTPRKRAEGKGASGTGTAHHWYMQVSAVALAFMVPTFLYIPVSYTHLTLPTKRIV